MNNQKEKPRTTSTCRCGRKTPNRFAIICPGCNQVLPVPTDAEFSDEAKAWVDYIRKDTQSHEH